jgi:hypothetical protein
VGGVKDLEPSVDIPDNFELKILILLIIFLIKELTFYQFLYIYINIKIQGGFIHIFQSIQSDPMFSGIFGVVFHQDIQ